MLTQGKPDNTLRRCRRLASHQVTRRAHHPPRGRYAQGQHAKLLTGHFENLPRRIGARSAKTRMAESGMSAKAKMVESVISAETKMAESVMGTKIKMVEFVISTETKMAR